jgi:hypothetical protein
MLLQVRQRDTERLGRTIRTRSATIVIDGERVTKIHRKEHLYRNERRWLELMAPSGRTPEILACSDRERSITMRYAGLPITPENAPGDWPRQMATVLSILAKAGCHHGDLLPQNILVEQGWLAIIDFALASAIGDPSLKKKRTFSDAHAPSRIGYLLNGFPGDCEVHSFVVWSMAAVPEVEQGISQRLEVIDKIVFSPLLYQDYCKDRFSWLKLFYQMPRMKRSAKGREPFCAFIVLSRKPRYAPRKRVFSSETRIVNTEIFDLKCALRAGRLGYLHSSDSQEEARANLRYLSYDEWSLPYGYLTTQRPSFASTRDVFEALNNLPGTEYILLRTPSGKSDRPEDYDILVNDYFACKRALGGFAYKSSSGKLFRNVGDPVDNGGSKVAHHVNVAGRNIAFDIRYVGDGYFPRSWQRRMLRDRVFKDGVFVCAPADDFFARAYHALCHKIELPDKYADEFAARLRPVRRDQLVDHLRQLVMQYLSSNNDRPTRPKDITIPYNPLVKSRFTEWRELYLARQELRRGNYSGASKILLNYSSIYRSFWTAGYWVGVVLFRWAAAGCLTKVGAGARALQSAYLAAIEPVNIWQPRRFW